ncbi:DUF4309 domain-containing protein [Brevibacillus daliensis]|uniref:DUF4309 domain-containing protein n=1 Tax=Brevibacillus daliensis TaxID=2892995 RepID=UPI001E2F1428|nr:DUF4309 domain-containing protein [Brevibacillus daliensis]
MSSDLYKSIEKNLSELPDVKMDPQLKTEMLTTILDEEKKWEKRKQHPAKWNWAGKIVVAGTLALGTFLLISPWDSSLLIEKSGTEMTGALSPSPDTHPAGEVKDPVLKRVKNQAAFGKIINANFIVGETTLNEVLTSCGTPDLQFEAAGLHYAIYTEKRISFQFGPDQVLREISSKDTSIQATSVSDLLKEWGDPLLEQKHTNQTVYIYQVNDQYQLKVFVTPPTKNENTTEAKIDRVTVSKAPKSADKKEWQEQQNYLESFKQVISKGDMIGTPFIAGKDTRPFIEDQIGKPDAEEITDFGIIYRHYHDRGLTFGYDKNGFLRRITTYEARLQNARLSDIEKVMGKTELQWTVESKKVLRYPINEIYNLEIWFLPEQSMEKDPFVKQATLVYKSIEKVEPDRNPFLDPL